MIYKGLNEEEARKRLKKYGRNEIKKYKKINPLKIFLMQFTSPLILLLIIASFISFFVSYFKQTEFMDSILILIIVFASSIAGFIQDYKAERAIDALQKMAIPNARVIRDGKEKEIKAIEIVPGDLLVLGDGDVIPADGKIIKGELEVDESLLTGESKARKRVKGDKVFSGCGIYSGKAIVEVFATGMKTQIGMIAEKMQEIEEVETSFQLHMKKFTRKIVVLTIIIIIITFVIGYGKFGIMEAGLLAISLAVAAIPENLPAVVTISLSLGARNMAKRNALVRRLVVTESMGSVDVICTDKTGTLTEGKMKVKSLWLLYKSEKTEDMAKRCCYYCNNAKKILHNNKRKWVGDVTEIALKQFSAQYITEKCERLKEIPFTPERKMMSVVCGFGKRKIVFSKGAPEIIIKKSNRYLKKNPIDFDQKTKKMVLEMNKKFASQGYRILALAYKDYEISIEKNLIFLGFAIISDPPRKDVREAVKECYSAGIRTIMITGDNPMTAKAIADEVGIKSNGIVTGDELDKMDEKRLEKTLNRNINIFARTSPFHKLKILEVLQKQGHVVVMTGDGVNDALAIKKADVGTSMGIKGTDVAKEASDIVLLDDNFATIRNAIEEGRRIFDNIRKFVNYLITCNIAEVLVILLATIFLPFLILFPIQILWINLITDGLPALALSMDPPRPDIMKRVPRKRDEGIINRKLSMLIGGIGIEKSIIILATFLATLPLGLDRARTTLFTGFIMYEFVRIGVIRYNERLKKLKYWFANRFLICSMILSFVLQLILIYGPISSYFKIVPLGTYEWFVLFIGTSLGFLLGILITKLIDRVTK